MWIWHRVLTLYFIKTLNHEKQLWFLFAHFWSYLLIVKYRLLLWIAFAPTSCYNLHRLIKIMLGSIQHQKLSLFIIYLLEDEQELSLGMLIRLWRIYNFWLFHAAILSFLYIFIIILHHFILFLWTNILIQCPVPVAVFCLFLVLQKINTYGSPNTMKLFDNFF